MFDTTGKLIYGAVPTNTLFAGFGGECEIRTNGDAVGHLRAGQFVSLDAEHRDG